MDAVLCRVCGAEVRTPEAVACASCQAPHHPDCWTFQGGCSIYGCGGEAALPWRPRPGSPGVSLTLAEAPPPPARAGVVAGLTRRLRHRARDLPRTLADGGFAALLTFLAYLLLEGVTGPVLRPLVGFLAVGLAHGLAAPFLAPVQHRHPAALGGLAAFGFLLAFPRRLMIFTLARGSLLVLLCSVYASSLAEAVAGDRTALGERLGAGALALRYVLTMVVASGLWLAVFRLTAPPDFQYTWQELRFFGLLGLLSAAGAAPALERGRDEFRKKLMASLPAREGDPAAP